MHLKKIFGIIGGIFIALIIVIIIILKSYDFNHLKPRLSEAVLKATGRELQLAGNIDLKLGLTPALVIENVSFANATWGSRPQMLNVGRFEAVVKLIPLIKKQIIIKRLILFKPDILIETDKSGKSNLEFEKKDKELKGEDTEKEGQETDEGLPALVFNELLILRGVLTYKDGKSDSSQVVGIERLSSFAEGIDTPINLELNASYNNKPFVAKGTVGSLASLIDPKMTWPLNIIVKAGGATIDIQGKVQDILAQKGIDVDFKIKGNKLKDLGDFIDTEMPIEGTYDISGKARDLAPKAYKISNLMVTLKDSDLGGDVDINLSNKKPKIKADLTARKIDLRPFFPKGSEKAELADKTSDNIKKERLFSNEALNLESIKGINFDARLKAEQIITPQLFLNNLNVAMVMREGQLGILPLKASMGKGRLDGRLSLTQEGETITISSILRINDLNLGAMLEELNITDMIEGSLDMDLDLKASGISIAEMMANLSGRINAMMGEGKIDNKYVDLLGADISSSVFRLLSPARQQENYTEINCFVARFDIASGIVETTALVLDTSQMSIVGDGEIDLRNEKLNISLKPAPKKGLAGNNKISLSLGELAKPFKLGGTLARPSLAIDPTQAAITVGKALGGMVAFGPAGILAALVSDGPEMENPCAAAIESANTGTKLVTEKKSHIGATVSEIQKGVGDSISQEKATEEVKRGVEDVQGKVKEIGNGLKKLFNK